MNTYRYTAKDKNNNLIKGKINAASEEEALLMMAAYDVELVSISFLSTGTRKQITKTSANGKNFFLKLKDKIAFTTQLKTLLKSGIPALTALEHILKNSPQLKIRIIADDLIKSIKNGSSLYDAMQELYPDTFGSVYLSIIKTGEESGELDLVLDRLETLLKKQQTLKNNMINASIYPIFLLILMVGLFLLCGFFIFPRSISFLSDQGVATPPFTQFLVEIFQFLKSNFIECCAILIGIFIACKMMLLNIVIKSKLDKFLLKIPLVSNIIVCSNLSNAMTLLYISYDSGVPMLNGMELVIKSINNMAIKAGFARMINLLKTGCTVSEAFTSTQVIPSEISSMVSTGDMSGNLSEMLKNCGTYLDEKLDNFIHKLQQVFPMIVLLCCAGGTVVFVIAIVQMYVNMLSAI